MGRRIAPSLTQAEGNLFAGQHSAYPAAGIDHRKFRLRGADQRLGGIGTCWIGFAQGWFETAEGKAALGLPASCVPVAPIIVGHPKAPAPPVPRKQPEIRFVG